MNPELFFRLLIPTLLVALGILASPGAAAHFTGPRRIPDEPPPEKPARNQSRRSREHPPAE